MKKSIISFTIIISLLLSTFGCSSTNNKEKYTFNIREEVKVETPDYSNISVIDKPEGAKTQQTIQYIDMNGKPWSSVMMMASLQGNVNKVDPSMYVLHDYMVEGNPALNAPTYWFEKLDESYRNVDGTPYFSKKMYTDEYRMILDNLDKISGIVLYHERLTDSAMYGKGVYGAIYSDVALLNLTLMMCGHENSIALNEEQYYILKEKLAVEGKDITSILPIKGDTTKFMLKNNGQIDGSEASRKSAAVWTKVYEYALTKYGKTSSKKGLAHNPAFQAAQFDWYIQNNVFVYNRSLSTGQAGNASEEENQLELDILNVTPPNTPVLGVWYLHLDEANYVNFLTGKGKYFIVSYESFNWSWTLGLERQEIETKEKLDIQYEKDKIYLAFSFTEGDNNSYLHFKMPQLFDSSLRGRYPFSWTIAPTAWETNPNIIKYLGDNWIEGDGLCIPEAGVDYVDPAPPKETAAGFYALSDEYVKRVNNANIRTLQHNFIDALSYAENMKNIDSLLCGYGIGISNAFGVNSSDTDFLFRGVPYINQLDGRLVYDNMKYIEGTDTQFYSISYSGWEHSLEDMCDLIDTLDDRYVVVTQKQLAKLYRDCYSQNSENLTSANFIPSMTREEMILLNKASNYGNFNKNEGYRYADEKEYFNYKLKLSQDIQSAKLNLTLDGNYDIEISKDYKKWYNIAEGQLDGRTNVCVDIPEFLLGQSEIYVRFGAKNNAVNGVMLYSFNLETDLSKYENMAIDTTRDAAFNLGNKGTIDPVLKGRKGEFVYEIPLKNPISTADVAIGLTNTEAKNVTLKVSADNKNYSDVELTNVGQSLYGKVSNLSNKAYFKINAEDAVSKFILSPKAKAVNSVSFRPLGNNVEKMSSLSADRINYHISSDISSQFASIETGNAAIYKFNFVDTVTLAELKLEILGQYKISISRDNRTYKTIKEVKLGDETPDLTQKFDISSDLTGGGEFYVKIEKSILSISSVSLRLVRITTNVNDAWLNDKISIENTPIAIVYADTQAEIDLIDQTKSSFYGIYSGQEGKSRKINAAKDGTVVYKLDFNVENAKYWAQFGLDVSKQLTKVDIILQVMNCYKLEISSNGTTYETFADVETLVKGGSNKANIRKDITSFLGENKVVYIKFSRGSAWNGSDEALLSRIRFVFEAR